MEKKKWKKMEKRKRKREPVEGKEKVGVFLNGFPRV